MTQIVISAEARADLDDIWIYIAADSIDNADRFLDRIINSITLTLGTFPLSGRSREELGEGLRSFPVDRHVVFYRYRKSTVEIVRIIHGARDLTAAFGKGDPIR